MKTRPILMSAPMVRALLDGRKGQTRRLIKPQPVLDKVPWRGTTPEDTGWVLNKDGKSWRYDGMRDGKRISHCGPYVCPYGQPGDLLWVRESIVQSVSSHLGADGEYHSEWGLGAKYVADGAKPGRDDYGNTFASRPSIHMPRWASRLTLELTGVRVERLQDISEAVAIAEGIDLIFTWKGYPYGWRNYLREGDGTGSFADPRDSYASLIDSINGRGSWDANPWVWVLTFRAHQQNVDALIKSREAA